MFLHCMGRLAAVSFEFNMYNITWVMLGPVDLQNETVVCWEREEKEDTVPVRRDQEER